MFKRFNKKGFTLIELLAVIVVLAIIMLLAVQAVLPQMEKARKNAFLVEAHAALDAAEAYTVQQALESGAQNAGSGFKVKISKLIEDNYYDARGDYKGCVTVSYSGGKYTYTLSMGNGQYKVSDFTSSSTLSAVSSGTSSEATAFESSCS